MKQAHTGCDYHDDCLECPYPKCIEEFEESASIIHMVLETMVCLYLDCGCSENELAEIMGVNKLQVQRYRRSGTLAKYEKLI